MTDDYPFLEHGMLYLRLDFGHDRAELRDGHDDLRGDQGRPQPLDLHYPEAVLPLVERDLVRELRGPGLAGDLRQQRADLFGNA